MLKFKHIMSKIKVKKIGIILEPTKNSFESKGVLNPGCYQDGKYVHMFYRALDKDMKSSIGYAKLEGPNKIIKRYQKPILSREYDYEKQGVEDPRIIKINKTFYLFYVAYDGKNAVTAYATSTDLKTFKKRGIITPNITYEKVRNILEKKDLKKEYSEHALIYENNIGKNVLFWAKDIFIFPKKINGKFYLITRTLPEIQIIPFSNFKELNNNFWKKYFNNLQKYIVIENKEWFEKKHIGGGCPPIETKDGWLLIYHAVDLNQNYYACAALIDKKNPLKLIAKLKEPLFSPTKYWEKKGIIPNVVFATGSAQFNDNLYIYYGAADKRIAVAEIKLNDLLKKLKNNLC